MIIIKNNIIINVYIIKDNIDISYANYWLKDR